MLLARFLSGSAATFALHLLTVVVTLFLTPILVGHLGKEDYGLWMTLVAFFAQYELLDFGMSQTATRYLSRAMGSEDEALVAQLTRRFKALFRASAVGALCLGGIACLVVPALIPDSPLLREVQGIVAAFAVVSALGFLNRGNLALLKARLLYTHLSLAALLRLIVSSSASLVAVLSGYGLEGLASAYLFGLLLEILTIAALAHRSAKPAKATTSEAEGTTPSLRQLLRYARTTYLGQIAHSLRLNVDPFVIAKFVGLEGVTYYAIGMRMVIFAGDLVNTISGGPMLSLFGHISAKDSPKTLQTHYLQSIRFSLAFATFLAASLAYYGEPFIRAWMGPGFEISYHVLLWGVVPVCLQVATFPAITLLYALDRHGPLVRLQIAGGIINLLLSVLFVRWWGIYGVVIATAIETTLMSGLLIPILACRGAKLRLRQHYLAVLRGCVPVLLILAPWFLLVQPMVQPSYASILPLAMGQTVYFAFAFYTFALRPDERRTIRSLYPNR